MTDAVLPITHITCIRVMPDRSVEVDRIQQFVQGDQVVGTGAGGTQRLRPEDDLSEANLEPEVVQIVNAVWTSDVVASALEIFRQREEAKMEMLRATIEKRVALETADKDSHETRVTNLKRTSDAIQASHVDLDQQHAVLTERMADVMRAREKLVEQATLIKEKSAELAPMVNWVMSGLPDMPELPKIPAT